MNPGKPWTLRSTIKTITGFFLLFIVIPGIAVFLPIWDIEPVDDADMWIVPEAVPDEQNSWPELVELYDKLDSQTDWNDFKDWWRDPMDHIKEIKEYMSKIDLENSLAPILEKPFCHPDFETFTSNGTEDYEIQRFFRKVLQFHLLSQDGPEAKFASALLYLRFMGVTKNAPSTSWGLILPNFDFSQFIDDVFTYGEIEYYSSEQLLELSILLPQLKVDWDQTWKRATLKDYRYISPMLPEKEAIDFWSNDYTQGVPAPWLVRKYSLPFLYQPNRTHFWILDSHRAALHDISPKEFPYPGSQTWEERFKRQISDDTYLETFLTFLKFLPNANGKLIFMEVTPYYDSQKDSMQKEVTWTFHSMQIAIELLRFEKEFGHLPNSLEDAKLDLPSEVALDPYDSKPIRYHPEKRMFYSVGKNEIDDGGEVSERSWEGDSVIKIPLLK